MQLPAHPLEYLRIENGDLFADRPAQPRYRYLDTPEIKIIAKNQATQRAEANLASYSFQLNGTTDPQWRELLKQELDNVPSGMNRKDLLVDPQGNVLVLTCSPVNLETKYQFVKECIQRTNGKYANLRNSLIQKVIKMNEEQRKAEEMIKDADKQIQKGFSDLKL
ncbi:MAG: hypothetical protein QM715_18580 [Nibricoccus sp.]